MKEQMFQNRIEAFCEEQQLLEAGDTIVVGVSGGADSICLLQVLHRMGYPVIAVHVNHGIREEAGEDEAYVSRFCTERGIPCEIYRIDVPEEARKHHLSEEEAGRMVRYRVLEEVRERTGAQKIALAHHQDDQAETVLMNLFRGSGIRGLAGMLPRRDCCIRPLLHVRRVEIEAYLLQEEISWQTDRTNKENTYTRNRLRNLLLPQINEEINSRAVEHIAETAEDLQLLRRYLQRQVAEAWERCVKEEAAPVLLREPFEAEDPLIRRELLKKLLEHTSRSARDLGRVHVESLEKLLDTQNGRAIDLPYGCRAERIYEGIRLTGPCTAETAAWNTTARACGGRNAADPEAAVYETGGTICTEVIELQEGEDPMAYAGEKRYTKWYDYDIIKYHPELRTRRSGDYMIINSSGSRQTLKKFFINEKIPAELRSRLPLVTIGDEVLWVVGCRMGERGKITKQTRRLLRVEYQPEMMHKEADNGRIRC